MNTSKARWVAIAVSGFSATVSRLRRAAATGFSVAVALSMLMLSPASLQAAPVSLDLGSGSTLWQTSATINAGQLSPTTAVLGFNCGGSCAGTLGQTFAAAASGLFDLQFDFGFGESACACDDPLRLRTLIDGAEVFSRSINEVIFSSPLGTPLVHASADALFLSAGSHTLEFEFARLNSPSFIRGPYFVLGGVSLRASDVAAPPNGVPEPAAGALVLAALGLLAIGRRGGRQLGS